MMSDLFREQAVERFRINIDEIDLKLVKGLTIDSDLKKKLTAQLTLGSLLKVFRDEDKGETASAEHEELEKQFPASESESLGRFDWWLWQQLSSRLPKFLYVDEYRVLPA